MACPGVLFNGVPILSSWSDVCQTIGRYGRCVYKSNRDGQAPREWPSPWRSRLQRRGGGRSRNRRRFGGRSRRRDRPDRRRNGGYRRLGGVPEEDEDHDPRPHDPHVHQEAQTEPRREEEDVPEPAGDPDRPFQRHEAPQDGEVQSAVRLLATEREAHEKQDDHEDEGEQGLPVHVLGADRLGTERPLVREGIRGAEGDLRGRLPRQRELSPVRLPGPGTEAVLQARHTRTRVRGGGGDGEGIPDLAVGYGVRDGGRGKVDAEGLVGAILRIPQEVEGTVLHEVRPLPRAQEEGPGPVRPGGPCTVPYPELRAVDSDPQEVHGGKAERCLVGDPIPHGG